MNTKQSPITTSGNHQKKSLTLKDFSGTASHFLLALISQIIELTFPGMLSGQVLTPELLTELIKTIIHSSN